MAPMASSASDADPSTEDEFEDTEDEDDEDDEDPPMEAYMFPGNLHLPSYLEKAAQYHEQHVGYVAWGIRGYSYFSKADFWATSLYARKIIDLVPWRSGEDQKEELPADSKAAILKIVYSRLGESEGKRQDLEAETNSLLAKLEQLLEIGSNVGHVDYAATLDSLKSAAATAKVPTLENRFKRNNRRTADNPPKEDRFPRDARDKPDVEYVLDLLRKCAKMITRSRGQDPSSERDLDVRFNADLFRCINDVQGLDEHYGEVQSLASRDRKKKAQKDGEKASHIRGAAVDWLWTSHHSDSTSNWGLELGACANVGAKRSNFLKLVTDRYSLAVLLRDIYSAFCQRIQAARNHDVDEFLQWLVIPGCLVKRWRYQLLVLVYVSHGWYALYEIASFEAPIFKVDNLGAQLKRVAAAMLRFRNLLRRVRMDYSDLLDPDCEAEPLGGNFKYCPADRT
ncbi:hypothetical protein HK104_006808 [Borealophlyctis nickersoniae]|nr:hypothetical protein HK104_006808 [Borealophlyctis nickersoniae]